MDNKEEKKENELRERIQKLLKDNKKTVNSIAKNKKEQRTLSRQINEKTTISSKTIFKIIEEFPNCSIEWLLTGSENMNIDENTPIRESDDSIYHYTNSYDGLVSIMNDKIKPQYSIEDFDYIQNNLKISQPIFCFCDIPIERHPHEHTEKYGEYGIGFKKEWAKENCLSTVQYIHYNSMSNMAIKFFVEKYNDIKECMNESKEADDIINALSNAVSIILMLIKPYEKGNKRFYDEKEWRYIYFNESGLKIPLSIIVDDENKYKDEVTESQKKINNENNTTLNFSVDNITHIFLKNEDEKDNFIASLKGYSGTEISKIRSLIRISAQPIQSEIKEEKIKVEEGEYNILLEENTALSRRTILALEESREALQKILILERTIHALEIEKLLGEEKKNLLVEGISAVRDVLMKSAS
jgi:hypothetical protein